MSTVAAAWLGIGLPLVVGCTHQEPADRSLDKLRADVAKLQAERDKLDQRVGALEAAEQQRRESQEAARKAGGTSNETDRRLPVVRVAEADARPGSPSHGEAPDIDTDGSERRPIVRATGSRGTTENRGAREGREETLSPEAKRDYEAAVGLAKGKQFDKALQAFTAFLVRFPDSSYAESAMFWRGECFYQTGAFSRAVEQFEGVIARFPNGNKTPDALLKLGLSQEKVGAKDQAQKTFAELKDRYPKSEAARQIPRP